ncbi:MAG: peptide ABC transporter substrate-binding protein [Fimbriimonas sp.]|nr:peptide ABC transporter substrate-binding protein [Fimbriimonas sp.]
MRRFSATILFALILLAIFGCGKGNFSERSSAGKQNIFRYPISTDMTTLDPAKVQDGDTIDAIQQVFEGLVKWDEKNQVVPNIAEKWDVAKDGRTYTFTLHQGVKFHNGREVTADDFKYSIERAANPDFSSPTAGDYLFAIDGFADRWAKKATELKGVKVIDKYHLVIVADKPRPYFLGLLTYPDSYVVCKEALNNGGEIQKVEQMVGTGPYKAESFQPDQLLVLAANKDYRDGAPKIDKIERTIIKDPQTRLNKFKSGELDLTRIERQDLPGLLADPKFKDQIHFFERPALYYVGLNCKSYAPFKDRNVRRAFAMAIDSEKLVNETLDGKNPDIQRLNGVTPIAHSILPPSVLGFRADAKYIPFNVAEAKRLLAAAGYPDGKNLPPLVIYHRDGQADVKLVAEAVATQLRQNLGIDCKTQMLLWAAYLDKHNKKELDFFHMRWSADYLDPQNFLSLLLSTTGVENRINYSNPEFDALCAKGDTMVGNDAERLKLYAQAEDIVLQDAPFVPIYIEKDAELISPRVHGLRESVFGHLPHTTVSLE